jgi:hypothetical protein
MQNNFLKEISLADKAIEALKQHFPVKVSWEKQINSQDTVVGFLLLENKRLPTEVRSHFQMYQMGEILKKKSDYGDLLLIADAFTDAIKTLLKKEGISYLDTAGNAFMAYPPHLTLVIEGKKREIPPDKFKDKAFTKAGMRLVFEYLKNPALLQLSYRKIMELQHLSLDTIAKTNASLKQQGFIRQWTDKQIALTNTHLLLKKWADVYETRIKPSLFYEKYAFLNAEAALNWQNIVFQKNTCWGGEPAAALLTQDLRPALFTIYTTETRANLMRYYRLKPDVKGNIHIYLPFTDMHQILNIDNPFITHNILTYMDLIHSGDARNFEVAQKIYEKYISILF